MALESTRNARVAFQINAECACGIRRGSSTPQNLASKVRVGSFKDPRQWVAEKGVLLYKGDNTFFALEHGIVEPHGTDTVLDT